jgi:hypothetical protein
MAVQDQIDIVGMGLVKVQITDLEEEADMEMVIITVLEEMELLL